MTLRFHSMILATSFAATVAVGIASAAIYADIASEAAPKADRLSVVTDNNTGYITIETRQDGVSVLQRVPVN